MTGAETKTQSRYTVIPQFQSLLYGMNISEGERSQNTAATCSSSLKGLVYGAILHRKELIIKQRVSRALQQFSINIHLTRKCKKKKKKKRRLPITRDVHKSHLIKHKSLSPWNQSAESHLKTEVRQSVFLVARNIHCKEATISFMFASPSNKLSAKYTGTKGWTVILPSLGHITIHQWVAISEYAAVMLFEPRIEKNKDYSNHAEKDQ